MRFDSSGVGGGRRLFRVVLGGAGRLSLRTYRLCSDRLPDRRDVAIADKKLSSDVGFKGLFRKILIFVMVGVGHLVDSQIIGDGSVLRTAVIFFYLSNEGVSLLENASYLGLPVPDKLRDVLAQLHDRSDKEGGR